MGTSLDPFDFLQATNGFPKQERATYRLATIDPTYSTGNPRVIFDGEATLSVKRYVVLNNYQPTPSERVLMAAVGKSNFVVMGSVGDVA